MGGPGIWVWGGAPRKKINDLNSVLKNTNWMSFFCMIMKDRFYF